MTYSIVARDDLTGELGVAVQTCMTRNNRRYLERVVHYLAGECGIRQFIDNGSGLPTQNNVHQVAQKVAPGSRVVYVEIDPVVLAHGRVKALLAEDDSTAFIGAGACDVDRILSHPDTQRLPGHPARAWQGDSRAGLLKRLPGDRWRLTPGE